MCASYRGDLVGAEEHFARLQVSSKQPTSGSFLAIASRCDGFRTALARGCWATPTKPASAIARMQWLSRDETRTLTIWRVRRFFATLAVLDSTREYEQAEDLRPRGARTISEEHGFSFCSDVPTLFSGWARAQLGRAAEGVALIRQGMAGLVEAGARGVITYSLTCLAEAQALDGAIVDALETVDEALQANPEELVYRPDILKLRGELRLKQGQTELAEADFREAIALAQKMSAKAWELRATTSLARLLAKQGRRDEARTMLAEIYGWFTEGFDTRRSERRQGAARRTVGIDGDAVREVQLRQPRRCTVLHEVRDQSRESLLFL